jgi:hypothetical protein
METQLASCEVGNEFLDTVLDKFMLQRLSHSRNVQGCCVLWVRCSMCMGAEATLENSSLIYNPVSIPDHVTSNGRITGK